MKWGWKAATIAGIQVYLHITFLIFLAWVLLSGLLAGSSWIEAAAGAAFVISIFLCVLFHELGHALAARRYGIKTENITLYPIGGVAQLERMPANPRQEMVVALAGPAVNVVIAALLWTLLAGYPALADTFTTGTFAERLLLVNVFIVLFNLLPAFPMDGGRVVRALLAMKLDYVRATSIAAGIGQGLALLFGFIGLFANPFLIFIALFVWIGAGQEEGAVRMKHELSGMTVARAMITRYQVLAPDDALAKAVDYVIEGFQQDFPVLEQGRLAGMLTRSDLMSGLASQGAQAQVRAAMQTEFETADPLEPVDEVLQRLQTCPCRSLPVMRGQVLVGIITAENIAELLMVERALTDRRGVRSELPKALGKKFAADNA